MIDILEKIINDLEHSKKNCTKWEGKDMVLDGLENR